MGNIISVDLSFRKKKCNALLSIVRLPLDMTISLPDSDVSLTYAMRRRALCCELAWLLSLGMNVGLGFEKQSNLHACCRMAQRIVRHVAFILMTVVRAKEAEELCALGQCEAAQVQLQLAIDLGHLPSRALKAWMLLNGREGVARDHKRGFELAKKGAQLGCHHCQGVLAACYWRGFGIPRDVAQSMELARESSGKGSRYGQFVLGELHMHGEGGVAMDYAQALVFFQLAAEQKFDGAQCILGFMCSYGIGVFQDYAEALRLYQLAAAQGYPWALNNVASCHHRGLGVPKNMDEAIRWYRRAHASGDTYAEEVLRRLGA
jgi:TPR repeat protein